MTRARRAAAALTALAALAGLAALAAGVPWLMWHVAGWPLPRRLPALAGLEAALAGPETPRAVISLLACAGWAAWAGFACQALAETAWQVRHLTALARARPGALRARAAALTPGRALAALLIGGTILGLLAALRGGAASADPALPSPAAPRALAGKHAEAPAPGPPPLPAAALYTVRPGDSLWAIAAERLGDGEAWHELWALNNGRPQPGGGALALPGLIQPGWILRLPAPPGPPPAPAPRPRPPARHGRHAPPPAPARPADGHRGQGIALPSGGLAGTALALAVTAALALAALHRRRRYRPGQDIPARLDPDLARPLPPVITALRRAAAPPPPDDPLDPYGPVPGEESLAGPVKPAPAQPPANPGDPDGPVQALPAPGARAAPPPAAPAGLIALGIRDGREAAADPAALGGLGLAGPGAPAAGRAILAALLSRALPGSPHGPAEVILTADAAARLLPGQGPAGLEGRLPGLAVAPDLDVALSLAEEAILRGARAGPQGGGGPAAPALIAVPGRPAAARLRAVLSAGAAGILLGPWPGGATCHVSPGGDAASDNPGLDGARLYTLAPGDASAVLDVLAAARGAPPQQPGPAARPPGPGPGTAAEPPPRRNPEDAPPAASSRLIRVEILGPVRITVRGQEVTGGLRKARELAAYLAARPDGATSDALTEELWPGSPHGAAQRALALRRLRDQLRAAAGVTEPRIVVLSGGRYRLDPSLAGTDYADFHAALDDARRAAGDGPRLAALRRAAALYRGPLADGEGYEWAEPLAEAARRRALDAWALIAEIVRPDDPDGALAALEAALGHDPYNEWLYQEVMDIQAAAGRAAAARRTLSLLETRLAEIGAAPGAQTRQVAAAILGPPERPPAL